MEAPLYNAEILRLAATIPHDRLPDGAQATARRTSPICGSRVTVALALDDAGQIDRFGQEVRACALGQASASILGRHVLGQTAQSIEEAHALLKAWLKGAGNQPDALAAHFPELVLLEPARAHPARHPSILLAFEATAAAAREATAVATSNTGGG